MTDFMSSIKTNRDKIGEGIYLLYFAVMVGARAAGLFEGMLLYNICLVLGAALFICKVFITEHTLKEYGIMCAFFALALLVYLNSGEKGLIVCFTMMFGMKGVSSRKVILTGAVTAACLVLGKIILGVFGILPEVYYPQERAGAGLMFRHAFGYAHPNTLHMNVLVLTMMVIYLWTTAIIRSDLERKNKLAYIYMISAGAFFFNVYIFMYSGSRTGVLACMAFLFCNIWLGTRKKIGAFEKVISYGAFPLACVISIILPLVLPERIFDFLNRTVFNSRFNLARYFWTNNHLSLFGIRLNNPELIYKTYGIDMAQMYLFLQLGVVTFLVMAALTVWFIYEAIKRDKRSELAVMLTMLFIGLWEPFLYNLGFKNFAYVFIGEMLYLCLKGDEAALPYEGIPLRFDPKRFFKAFTAAVLSGLAAALIFLLATAEPSALYGDRESGENGVSFGMEAHFMTDSEVRDLEAKGDIFIGYKDDKTPMYKYSKEIAEMEYVKKAISVGVWTGLLALMVLCRVLSLTMYKGSMV